MKPQPRCWPGQPRIPSSPCVHWHLARRVNDPALGQHPLPDSCGEPQPEYRCPDFCCLVLPLPTLSLTETACELFKPTKVCFVSSPKPVMINCCSHFEISAERVPVLFPRMQHHQHFSIIQIGFSLSSSPSRWKELRAPALPLISLTLM